MNPDKITVEQSDPDLEFKAENPDAEPFAGMIAGCLDDFDFHKVQRYMASVGWTWHDQNGKSRGVPGVLELRTEAKNLLRMAIAEPCFSASSGGLSVHWNGGQLELSFQLEYQWSEHPDCK